MGMYSDHSTYINNEKIEVPSVTTIIKILNITKHYNIILIYLLFILLPLFNILAAKILKKDFKFIAIVSPLICTYALLILYFIFSFQNTDWISDLFAS